MIRRPSRPVWVLAVAGLLTGCALKHPVSALKQTVGKAPQLELQGTVVPDANSDSPIPLDVVIVRDKTALKQIEKMDAAAWFGDKGRCTFRGGSKAKVEFHSWEFVPGQSFTVRVRVSADTNAVLAFANYASAAPHRMALPNSGAEKILLDKNGATVEGKSSNPSSDATLAPEIQKVCPDD